MTADKEKKEIRTSRLKVWALFLLPVLVITTSVGSLVSTVRKHREEAGPSLPESVRDSLSRDSSVVVIPAVTDTLE